MAVLFSRPDWRIALCMAQSCPLVACACLLAALQLHWMHISMAASLVHFLGRTRALCATPKAALCPRPGWRTGWGMGQCRCMFACACGIWQRFGPSGLGLCNLNTTMDAGRHSCQVWFMWAAKPGGSSTSHNSGAGSQA
jgi:hypothetical protein